MSTASIPGTSTIVELTDQEQAQLVIALEDHDARPNGEHADLMRKVTGTTEYLNPRDEYVRRTLRKRRLEAEIRAENKRLADLEQDILEDMAAEGEAAYKHAATGKTVVITQRVYAKPAEDRDKAGAALQDAGLGDLVQRTFNTNTVSAHFNQAVKDWRDENPGTPVPPIDTFLAPAMREAWRLEYEPKLTVR